MDGHFIVTTFVIIDDFLKSLRHQTHCLATVTDAEVLTVAVIAAKSFGNNHKNALFWLQAAGFIPKNLDPSRFSRRLDKLADWLELLLETIGELYRTGKIYIIDSMPLPVCQRVRAMRCKKVRGKEFCGHCVAKKQKFFGYRLHLICDTQGMPVSFSVIAGGFHDLTPIHELTYGLPEEASVYGDKAFNAAADEASILEETGVKLIPLRKKNMKEQNTLGEFWGIQRFRKRIETVYSQLEAMGIQRLRARTRAGFMNKTHASLLALAITNHLLTSN